MAFNRVNDWHNLHGCWHGMVSSRVSCAFHVCVKFTKSMMICNIPVGATGAQRLLSSMNKTCTSTSAIPKQLEPSWTWLCSVWQKIFCMRSKNWKITYVFLYIYMHLYTNIWHKIAKHFQNCVANWWNWVAFCYATPAMLNPRYELKTLNEEDMAGQCGLLKDTLELAGYSQDSPIPAKCHRQYNISLENSRRMTPFAPPTESRNVLAQNLTPQKKNIAFNHKSKVCTLGQDARRRGHKVICPGHTGCTCHFESNWSCWRWQSRWLKACTNATWGQQSHHCG